MNQRAEIPIFEGLRAEAATFLGSSFTDRWYTYVLCRPDGTPFYVGKGSGRRMLEHELEAMRQSLAPRSNPLKCNVIRKIFRQNGQILYRLDRTYAEDQQRDCLLREAALIARYGRIPDGGILTNLAAGLGAEAELHPISRKRHADTLSGVPNKNPERAALNLYLRSFGMVESTCIKPLSQYRPYTSTVSSKPRTQASRRMCYALMASAVAHGMTLEAGAAIPRSFVHRPDPDDWPEGVEMPEAVEAIIENGVSSVILKVGLAELLPASDPKDEAYQMNSSQISILIQIVGRRALELRGLI
ncbi:hypothetical protein ROG8370_01607 [Roseovarius gaetbuli]|uniref:GIY-YIG domain-containing protein n=1 Tax=Roseovarius gaetbuli TaxID=1356575 RepID=A0A1X6Z316_9RHOB|nr:GIY-YIG nuclease family protein [Roseovarius gaetbuli]SLN39051.1 hypothetical protein ROG8370_01607 [Roseovarius gaetbuli]